ncbi:glycerol-3-phosphate dehydrogenase/oxidase [Inhella sp.]|uniref:glycerol-3-phosphate dehydrogenase/oxidase n=1 Tax=Inhella sp. TaxID=1921806 RepID=UPI0035B16BBA
MQRSQLLERLRRGERYDLIVVGGGATGLGLALDAAQRGLRTALLEAEDFAKGTSSRSTKLLHGGVRYLAQGQIGLVREALHERATVLANAPHLASPLGFVTPARRFWQAPYYGLGLKAYEWLAGRRSLGPTEFLRSRRVTELLPGAAPAGLRGGVRYWDAQFDDARLALALARTALARGADLLNHCEVTALRHEKGHVAGVQARCRESGEVLELSAACVVNATGVWVDALRGLDAEAGAQPAPTAMLRPSQGVHLVVDRSFLGGDHALLVPRTDDGRVLFAVPWLGSTLLGTTDTPRDALPLEPEALQEEVAFILREAGRVLRRAPQPADVRSCWVGLRPLVKPEGEDGGGTGGISREHTVRVAASGLVTVTGGKWTTYRAMAEDVLERCAAAGLLPATPAGGTERLPLVGAQAGGPPVSAPPGLHGYGSEAAALQALPGANNWLWQAEAPGCGLSEAMVRFAARHELARSVEDVLARRCRLLFLDAARAEALAAPVAALLAEELGRTPEQLGLEPFIDLARRYRQLP